MRYADDTLIYSPTDLCRFMESRFASWMDRLAVERRADLRPDEPTEDQMLARRRGIAHERACVEALVAGGADVAAVGPARDRRAATLEAMRRGRGFIQQAPLFDAPFEGYADLLVRVDGPSRLGDFHYVPREIKLAFGAKPKHIVQLCAYADMLETMQGVRPERLEVVLGNGEHVSLRTADFYACYRQVKRAFLEQMDGFDPAAMPVPEPGADHAPWESHAAERLERLDHLSRVAGIRATQVKRLEAAGIGTMRALAAARVHRVSKVEAGVFDRLRRQARLQIASAGKDRPEYEILVPERERPSGLALLPPASPSDVFFDIEGYPFVEGGLEYLLGATYLEGGERRFRDFWAHDAGEERAALEGFVDWVHARWRADPTLHIYHYAPYEITALCRLMGRHATREAEIDQLLRKEVFVDLYAIVRRGLLVGEPSYSLKNVERLYREARSGDVETAVDSIVEYQRWLDSGEPRDWRESPILRGIRDYNRDDCDSTLMLAEWLRRRARESGIDYAGRTVEDEPKPPESELSERAQRRRALAERMLEGPDVPPRHLLGQLVEFHRREDKPMWWQTFARHEMTDDELYEDLACLGRLRRDGEPELRNRSQLVPYAFDPDQDTRLDEGQNCYLAHDLEARVEIHEIDRRTGRVVLRFGPGLLDRMAGPPPAELSLIPDEFVPSEPIEESIEHLATEALRGRPLPKAIESFLRREPPRLRGHDGPAIARPGEPHSDAAVRVAPAMRETTLTIQGPPGSGKTHTAARMILRLIGAGRRVGITSNSHKAILNLMVKCAELNGGRLDCLKVGGEEDDPLLERIGGVSHQSSGSDGARVAGDFRLIGGTAWLFSRADMRGTLDYLFVDEAGQVSVANLVGMSPAARNLVLVGDQMQLGQPTQGTHPGDSGASTLDYLLQGERTIPGDRGLFLDVTYRLHPEICRLNSDAFYEGKLRSAPGCGSRRVVVEGAGGGLPAREAGILFVPVEHEGNTQGSDEEAEVVRRLYVGLLRCDHVGRRREPLGRLTRDDILVVAPYNMQVRNLERVLPDGARVGSVDKFQGQEAPVVIVSMCASEGHDSPRGIEFLLSPNRLNVALSRAQTLAIVVGHPGLARTRCSTVEQMRLVNLYCRIVEEGSPAARPDRAGADRAAPGR